MQYEAIPESLKNMLLVMSTQGIFDTSQSESSPRLSSKDASLQLLWVQTQQRIEKFLPNLLRDLFPGLVTTKEATHPIEVAVATPSPVESPVKSSSTSPLSTSPRKHTHTHKPM